MSIGRAVVLILGVIVFGPAIPPAYGCDCLNPGAACSEFAKVDAVFAGRVRSIDNQRIEFAVSEAFRGIKGPTATLRQTGSNCDYQFTIGQEYFVYAYEGVDAGPLHASICSRTGLLSQSADDLAYARRVSALPADARARLTGSVVRWQRSPVRREPFRVAGVPVVLTDAVRTFRVDTDRKGRFQFSGVPFGKYDVRVEAPPGFRFNGQQPVNLLDANECTPLTLGVGYDGRVTGRVLKANGENVGGVALTILQTTAANALPLGQTRTSIDGRFELQGVDPGSYFLRIDAAPGGIGGARFYHGDLPATADGRRAVRLKVGPGKHASVNAIKLAADTPLVTMTGTVVDDQGRPAVGAEVHLSAYPRIPLAPLQRTGPDGRFVVAVVPGGRYSLLVNYHVNDARGRTRALFSGEAKFVGTSSAPPISVALKRRTP